MKLVFSAIIGGVCLVVVGLVLEFLGVSGMCNRTGYWHLQKLDSLLYALHSESNVIIVVAACNFFIGSVLGLITGAIFIRGKN
jgi:hypothetical protein